VIDIERVVVQHLLADPDVTDLVGENGVSTELPPNAVLPRIRITLNGGTIPVRGYLYASRVTVEAWADTKGDAWDVLAAAVASLENTLEGALVEGVVVTAVDQESGATWVPDPEAQTPRYLATVTVTAHRQPAAPGS
jgi:hypothetical protein